MFTTIRTVNTFFTSHDYYFVAAVVMERKHFLFIAFIRECQKKAVKQTKALETGARGFAGQAT